MASLSLNTQLSVLPTATLDSRHCASTQPWEGQQILLYHLSRRVIVWDYI